MLSGAIGQGVGKPGTSLVQICSDLIFVVVSDVVVVGGLRSMTCGVARSDEAKLFEEVEFLSPSPSEGGREDDIRGSRW